MRNNGSFAKSPEEGRWIVLLLLIQAFARRGITEIRTALFHSTYVFCIGLLEEGLADEDRGFELEYDQNTDTVPYLEKMALCAPEILSLIEHFEKENEKKEMEPMFRIKLKVGTVPVFERIDMLLSKKDVTWQTKNLAVGQVQKALKFYEKEAGIPARG